MLVIQRTGDYVQLNIIRERNDVALREWNRREFATLKPMYSGSVDSDGLLSADVGTILEISVLALLLSLEIQAFKIIRFNKFKCAMRLTSQSSKVLLYDSLVHSGTTSNPFSIVMSDSEDLFSQKQNI